MTQITIIASIRAKTDKIDLVKAQLEKLAAISRAEEGCINYDLHQDNEDHTQFLLYENWQSRDLWQTHMKNKHIEEYVCATQGAVEQFAINEMTMICSDD